MPCWNAPPTVSLRGIIHPRAALISGPRAILCASPRRHRYSPPPPIPPAQGPISQGKGTLNRTGLVSRGVFRDLQATDTKQEQKIAEAIARKSALQASNRPAVRQRE